MLYEVKLSAAELDTLAVLPGKCLELITSDGWSAELHTQDRIIRIEPDESATPDDAHPHGEVERPRVEGIPKSRMGTRVDRLGGPFGLVREVQIVSTLLSFSPVVTCPAVEIVPGVVLPERPGYCYVFYTRAEWEAVSQQAAPRKALIDLDIAVELVTESNPGIALYTSGYFINVSLTGLPEEDEWVKFGAFSRRPLLNGLETA